MERNKTKEQLEEEKKISLSFRIKPLAIEGLGEQKLREKAQELWELIVKLETEKYDLEERQKRQDYDVSIQIQLDTCTVPSIKWRPLAVERAEGKTEATAQAQSLEEGSRPRSFDWQIPGKNWTPCPHTVLFWQQISFDYSPRFKSPPNMRDVWIPAHMTTRRSSSRV